ncbi:MAG: phenylalanine--tRNA ligase subunit alpha [Deltaproteobacteria bacterium]|nr:phenylalanine--tRNA ligase subunit alpha [Deltaproteobacteria bacterium]MBW2254150.1 phenylalanine--tRNA ligase subunit alpha [Deltaproteobacteria bacterium]
MSQPDVDALMRAFREALDKASDPKDLDEIRRVHTAGRKSAMKDAFRALREVPPQERPAVAKALNETRATMEAELEAASHQIEAKALQDQLDAEWVDLTMPGVARRRGARHPLTEVEDQCMEVLRRLGFQWVDGPEVEHPYYNFDALNIPEHHPARDMQDTFWVTGGLLLRSHTTTVQARVLQQQPPLPIRIASMGRVYRNEAVDSTHVAMFHQLEGLWIDKGLTFSHLKGILSFIAHALYGEDRKTRFKPKFYPYTEPSVGVDVSCGVCGGTGCEACHDTGWVTILGAGMVHPKVFLEFGYDPREISGIAFGLGTTRMAAQWSGVVKIKSLYDQDLRVLRALHRGVA